MNFICSDTNVWIDFYLINRLEFPFRLPCTYIMNEDAINNELLSPPDLPRQLVALGLVSVEITLEEFELAEHYIQTFRKLSKYDALALAISKVRSITLLTGDKALRNAAKFEQVSCLGTLGILDKLLETHSISPVEYVDCLQRLKEQNGGEIRLPNLEILNRLQLFLK